MTFQFTERLTKLPAVPKKFGDDGGKFYKYYDELADELDEDMVTSLKSQLDGVLIFAGLFAGVNSAFLAFTLPQMSADPADDTNALLFQIMRGANGTITSPADLPSASFSPPTRALPINILFSMSLTLALLASFLAVLGQQWLVYYRKRSGGGAEYQRWEQLRRYLGAKRWRLELVLDDILPSVLQIALVIFCAAFILYLGTLSRSLCYAIAAPLCIVGLLIPAMAIFAAWDRWCPFKSPLSHVVEPALQPLISVLGRTLSFPASYTIMAFRWLVHTYQSGSAPFVVTIKEGFKEKKLTFSEAARHKAEITGEWFKRNCRRRAEAIDHLEVVAFKRVFCTSEDPNALIYAAVNGQAIRKRELLRQILDDPICGSRIRALIWTFEFGWNYDDWQIIKQKATASLFFHAVLTCGSIEDFLPPKSLFVEDSILGPNPRQVGSPRERLALELSRLYDVLNGCVEDNLVECSYRIVLENCLELLIIAFCGGQPLGAETLQAAHLPFRPLSKRSAPDELVSLVALGIMEAKAWDEHALNDGSGLEGRGVLASYQKYQQRDKLEICEDLLDAIETLVSPWKGQQPDHKAYVLVFERVIETSTYQLRTVFPRAPILRSLLILLRSLEREIRDSSTLAHQRHSAREYRTGCSNMTASWFATGPIHDWDIWGPTDVASSEIIEVSGFIQTHIDWMKDMVCKDPMNPDNPSMVESFKTVLGILPEPNPQALELREQPDHPQVVYLQLHPTLLKTMSDIEAALPPAACSILEEHFEDSQPKRSIMWKDQYPDAGLELWGN